MIKVIKPSEYFEIVKEYWIERAKFSVDQTGRFDVALSGGSTPKRLYQELAKDKRLSRKDWRHIHLWFGDERAVPPDSGESNYRMAKEALFDHVELGGAHRIESEREPLEAAKHYSNELSLLMKNSSGRPIFDLVMLGLGEDGHIASLFPNSDNLKEKLRHVSASYVESVDSWRISLTMPVILAARELVVLVTGDNKAEILKAILLDEEANYPASEIREKNNVVWFLDTSAAKCIGRR